MTNRRSLVCTTSANIMGNFSLECYVLYQNKTLDAEAGNRFGGVSFIFKDTNHRGLE